MSGSIIARKGSERSRRSMTYGVSGWTRSSRVDSILMGRRRCLSAILISIATRSSNFHSGDNFIETKEWQRTFTDIVPPDVPNGTKAATAATPERESACSRHGPKGFKASSVDAARSGQDSVFGQHETTQIQLRLDEAMGRCRRAALQGRRCGRRGPAGST